MLIRWLLISLVSLVLGCVSVSAQLTEQQQIQKLNYVYQHLRNNYVDDVPLEPLVEEAIKATLKELDPHSTYLSKEQMTNLRTRLRGEFAGIGIRYIVHNDTLVVRNIIDSSPAQRANIKFNDRIVTINDQSVVGLSSDSIATLLRGEQNSRVTLGIARRSEDKLLKINLQRDIIESSAISASFRINDIGYISISNFSKPLASEFLKAYKELGDIRSLIVDLRDNGGGAITSAIDLSGLFLKDGDVIVSTEGRTNNTVYDKKRDGQLCDTPLVVIINENSASASEIFAGAIQDHDRGVIIGHTSFGKGLVQRVIDLKDGSGISLTIARYKTPVGRIIQRPYTLGDGDEYQRDTARFMHPDSIEHNPELMFSTLKRGRKVYGGGGITPDVYINTDNLKLSDKTIRLYSNAIFEHTVVELWDRVLPATIREQYPTAEAFAAGFTLGDDIVDILCRLGSCSMDDFAPLDQKFVRYMLLATIAEQLYGNNARSYVYGLGFDIMVQRAVAIAGDEVAYNDIFNATSR
jgi:carboxyl-terminal processing protease